MNADDLKLRTKRFGLRVLKLVNALQKTIEGRAVAAQLVRSGTSVAANYRAACRARSKAEFISKLGTVEGEADESALWMELITQASSKPQRLVKPLHDEAVELTRIIVASIRTARGPRH